MRETQDRGYQHLIAWQRGIDLVRAVYEATAAWPKEEQFGLINQVRRAAVSVPSDLAEGQGRSGTRGFLHHLSLAHGSLCEAETQLLIAYRLGYMGQPAIEPLLHRAAEVGRLTRGLIKSLR